MVTLPLRFGVIGSLHLATAAIVLSGQTVPQLEPHRVKVESVEYQGKRAVRLVEDGTVPNGEAYALVKGSTNGV